jgi:kynurenine 3-monooxygenase
MTPSLEGKHRMHAQSLHIWPRKSFMLIALPNIDGSFTCTLFLPMEGDVSFKSLQKEDDVMEFFETYFPDTLQLMPSLIADYLESQVSVLGYVKCFPYGIPGKVLLLGDAAHAIVPFYGQGMNAGFEDCSLLHEWADLLNNDIYAVSQAFINSRKTDADAISDLALHNFIEMRDLVANPDFLLKKKIEAIVDEYLGDSWTPLYSMVSFSHTPYSQALKKGIKHDAFITGMIQFLNISADSDLESVKIKNEIIAYINSNYKNQNETTG